MGQGLLGTFPDNRRLYRAGRGMTRWSGASNIGEHESRREMEEQYTEIIDMPTFYSVGVKTVSSKGIMQTVSQGDGC